jgi:hypothetical protein
MDCGVRDVFKGGCTFRRDGQYGVRGKYEREGKSSREVKK